LHLKEESAIQSLDSQFLIPKEAIAVKELSPKCDPYKLMVTVPVVGASTGEMLLSANAMYENIKETDEDTIANETCTGAAKAPEQTLDFRLESEVHAEKIEAVEPNLANREDGS
jgi:hypothetical protein